jgi:uncharacterized protein
VLVNAPFLLTSSSGTLLGGASTTAWWDFAAEWFVAAAAQGKSYLLFALLFGYSAAIMLGAVGSEPGSALDAGRRRAFRRRLLALGVLGLLHAALLFVGDILVPYAVLGLLLPLLVTRSPVTLRRVAVGAWAGGAACLAVLVLLTWSGGAEATALWREGARLDAAVAEGSFLDQVDARVAAWPGAVMTIALLNGPLVVGAFALGAWAGRVGLLARPEQWVRSAVARRVSGAALLLGVPLAALAGWLQVWGADRAPYVVLGVALGFASAPLLSAGYVVWLARLSSGTRLRWARPAGRQSLTGYVTESLLLLVVAAGWGLGLHGELGAAAVMGVAVAVWATTEALAHLWSRWFAQGPLEWLVRWWTAQQRPPLRRVRAVESPSAAGSRAGAPDRISA